LIDENPPVDTLFSQKTNRTQQQQTTTIMLLIDLLSTASQSPLMAFVLYATAAVLVAFAALILYVTRWPKARMIIPRRASHFRPDLVPDNIDTIVIGSGSGGSTCANLLAQSGQRVLILEQHEVTGGCTHSFRINGCEYDTGLHYVPKDMSDRTARSGAIMDFMTHGSQKWTPFPEGVPYDEIVFPPDSDVKPGAPNNFSYPFFSGAERTVNAIVDNIDPGDEELKNRTRVWMDICQEINSGFVALGIKRVLPSWLHFLVRNRVDR
jgi:all-trans-retinol 13,14-reductase